MNNKYINIQLPATVDKDKYSLISVVTMQPYGVLAKILVQRKAKKIDLYNVTVLCNLKGKDKKGNTIEVNNLGRWLFGVPGANSHLRIISKGNNLSIHYPKDVHPAIDDFINQLKIVLETENRKS